jgi:membrane fusion protein, macrolide-specific efflux system
MKKILWFVLIAALVATGWGIRRYYAKPEAPGFSTAEVKKSSVEVVVTATGGVQAQNRLEIKPPIAGRIEEILVKEGEKVAKRKILAWMSSTERVAMVDTATARGEKERKKWEALYRPTPILAPLTGILILKNVEPGQTVAATDVVMVMSDHLIVRADVDETDIGRIKVGQVATLTLDAYPKNSIKGHVDHIAFDAKTANNVTVYQVDIAPESVPDFMRSGMTANVGFDIERRDDVLVVPQEAVAVNKDGESFVKVPGERPNSPPKEVTVKTGLSDGRRTEITDGLEEGAQVLVPKLNISDRKGKSGTNPFSPMRGPRK